MKFRPEVKALKDALEQAERDLSLTKRDLHDVMRDNDVFQDKIHLLEEQAEREQDKQMLLRHEIAIKVNEYNATMASMAAEMNASTERMRAEHEAEIQQVQILLTYTM